MAINVNLGEVLKKAKTETTKKRAPKKSKEMKEVSEGRYELSISILGSSETVVDRAETFREAVEIQNKVKDMVGEELELVMFIKDTEEGITVETSKSAYGVDSTAYKND